MSITMFGLGILVLCSSNTDDSLKSDIERYVGVGLILWSLIF